MEELADRYIKYFERYKQYQDLADSMRIDGHEGMAKAWQRTANSALDTLRIIEAAIRLNTKYGKYRGGRVDIYSNGIRLKAP